jgi:transcription elongation factor Elf1
VAHIKENHPETLKTAYACSVCGEEFVDKSDAEKHARMKHPELFGPSFHCKLCEKRFSTEAQVKTHILKEHGDHISAVTCPICGDNVASRDLIKHVQRRHPEILARNKRNSATLSSPRARNRRPSKPKWTWRFWKWRF